MKTETQQFIEDAIKGGWKEGNDIFNDTLEKKIILTRSKDGAIYAIYNYSEILLDPKAWEAVAGTRGWDWAYCYTCKSRVPLWGQCECDEDEQQPEAVMAWHRNWTRFIDHLADGKTIEEALLAIK